MKRILILTILFLAVAAGFCISAQDRPRTPFAYPFVPDSITDFNARADFFVGRFWDRIDLKRAFSSHDNVEQAFADFLGAVSVATADTAYSSIERMMQRLSKQPKDQLFMAGLGERYIYGDSATLASDELYFRMLGPLLANKKVNASDKARFQYHYNQLSRTLPGHPMGELRFTGAKGQIIRFIPRKGQAVIIYFNDPDCPDCWLARVRLMADPQATAMIEAGQLAIVALTPGEPDDAWKTHAASLPATWLAGASPDLDMEIDLRGGIPSFYLIDEEGILRAKGLSIDSILNILSRVK